jgi:hypothetical protein
LIILNDTPGQWLECDVKEVRILNVQQRLSSIGAKRNMLTHAARADSVCLVWDDDDISLPGRISQTVVKLLYANPTGQADYFNPGCSFWLDRDTLHSDHKHQCTHNASAYTVEGWKSVGGYPDLSMGEDQEMDKRMKLLCRTASSVSARDPSEWQYVYRWGWSDFHISACPTPESAYAVRGIRLPQQGTFEITPGYTERTRKILGHLL